MGANVRGRATVAAGMPASALPFYRTAAGDPKRAFDQDSHAESSLDPQQEAVRADLGRRLYQPRTLQEFCDWDLFAVDGMRESVLAGVESAVGADTFDDPATTYLLMTTDDEIHWRSMTVQQLSTLWVAMLPTRKPTRTSPLRAADSTMVLCCAGHSVTIYCNRLRNALQRFKARRA
jgi:hypothetical protein